MVEKALLQRGETRDNDDKLVAIIWHNYLKEHGHDPNQMTGVDVLTHVFNGWLPSSDTITRARRKLQETQPALRGKKYYQRHANSAEVKKDLGYQ